MDDLIQVTKFEVRYEECGKPMYHYMYFEDSDGEDK